MTRRPDELRGATLTGTGMYVPDRVLDNHNLERMVETSDEWIRERTGIRERRIAAPDQASSDLAVIAAQRALESAGLAARDVDQIIVATTTPDRILPSCACTVQAKLGATRAAAYDVFAACTGFIYGLGIARGAIGSGLADNVLLIGVETLSRIVDYTDRNTCVLFGDGAGAAVLQPCPSGEGIRAISMQSDGALGDVLEVPAGGSRLPASAETVEARGHFIKMRGRELFKIAVRAMEESVQRALETSGLAAADIDLLIPHQANLRIIDAVQQRLGLPAGRVIVNIERYGNTSSASIPISLDEVVREGRLKPGDHVCFVAFGGGATWGASMVRWTKPAPIQHELAVPAVARRAHS
ncbi:MAG TPA: beta-ketoacyl-ACP synthase III [Candidatus Eisenbacteria bacterium]|jgi:3-oxoacyl-[acyl-carrier-protein] synthase-3